MKDDNVICTVEDNNQIRTFQGHTHAVNCVAKLTEPTLVSGSYDQTLELWK